MQVSESVIASLYEYMAGPSARVFLPGRISYSRQEVYYQQESTAYHADGSLQLKSGVSIAFSLEVAVASGVRSITFRTGNMAEPLVLKSRTGDTTST